MAYKVTFETLAITGEDVKTSKPIVGNVAQGMRTIYTDAPIHSIESIITADLESQKLIPVIKTIEHVPGKCLN
jgi:hypothetical protein